MDPGAPVSAALILAVGSLHVAFWAGGGAACGFRTAAAACQTNPMWQHVLSMQRSTATGFLSSPAPSGGVGHQWAISSVWPAFTTAGRARAGLLRKRGEDARGLTLDATLASQLDPAGGEQLAGLARGAADAWWRPGHPGWTVCPHDSDEFLRTYGAVGGLGVSCLPMQARLRAPCPRQQDWAACAAGAGVCGAAARGARRACAPARPCAAGAGSWQLWRPSQCTAVPVRRQAGRVGKKPVLLGSR